MSLESACNAVKQTNSLVCISVHDEAQAYFDVWFSHCQFKSVKRNCDGGSKVVNPQRHFAWIITSLALRYSFDDAVVLANSFANVSRETWPRQFDDFGEVIIGIPDLGLQPIKEQTKIPLNFTPVSKEKLALYPIVDNAIDVESLLNLGAKTVQIRLKHLDTKQRKAEYKKAIDHGKRLNAQVFINDDWQLAIELNAYGVHLGQEDLATADLIQICNAGLALGVSTHGYFEILKTNSIKPSYIAFGQVYMAKSKVVDSAPLGLTKLRLFRQLVESIKPSDCTKFNQTATVAIGGITLDNANQVLSCNVDGIAVISAIAGSNSQQDTVNRFLSMINKHVLAKSASATEATC
nr:thiamine phosphate synthase [Vibrio sinus]